VTAERWDVTAERRDVAADVKGRDSRAKGRDSRREGGHTVAAKGGEEPRRAHHETAEKSLPREGWQQREEMVGASLDSREEPRGVEKSLEESRRAERSREEPKRAFHGTAEKRLSRA
jgi:hypothetical protein